jgi:hypothetical protein
MAPWLEEINVTPELILKYQLQERDLTEILSEDFKALQRITQVRTDHYTQWHNLPKYKYRVSQLFYL